jgi:hypothetical protein
VLLAAGLGAVGRGVELGSGLGQPVAVDVHGLDGADDSGEQQANECGPAYPASVSWRGRDTRVVWPAFGQMAVLRGETSRP